MHHVVLYYAKLNHTVLYYITLYQTLSISHYSHIMPQSQGYEANLYLRRGFSSRSRLKNFRASASLGAFSP